MANRRCLLTLTRHCSSLFSSYPSFSQPLKSPFPALSPSNGFLSISQTQPTKQIFLNISIFSRHFCSGYQSNTSDDDDEAESEYDEAEDDEAKSAEEIENEAAEIGYKVVGPLQETDLAFKPYEPVFAIVQVGSHQFKVSNGDTISTEKLKYCDVNDKLILNKVLMLGTRTQTIIGRPVLPDAAVHAVVEEHALDAKVLIFKKKRRKNYRRTRGHRQELTRLRITDIQGIEKPESSASGKTTKAASKKVEKIAVAA